MCRFRGKRFEGKRFGEKRCVGKNWTVARGLGILLAGLGCISMTVSAGRYRREPMGVPLECSSLVSAGTQCLSPENGCPESDSYSEGIFAQSLGSATSDLIAPDDGIIRIVLDPGHGGVDEGCEKYHVQEKEINLAIALQLREKLEELDRGYEVLMTRDWDVSVALEERVDLANEANADLFVSIHQNACEDASISGAEIWYCGYYAEESGDEKIFDKDSERLARLIQKRLINTELIADRGIKETDELCVVRSTQMPACLVETGFLTNTQENAQLQDETYQQMLAEEIAIGIDHFFFPKTMYLTFDDGPTEENTSAVLDILKDNDIQATFFLVGENVEKHPEVAKRIAEEGHTVGIHCYSHDYEAIYESADAYLEDFEKAKETVQRICGVEVKLFRFPGGSVNAFNEAVREEIAERMTEQGYLYYDWNASLEDASRQNDPEKLLQNARESTLGRRRIIMLGHDVVYNTTICLQSLIDEFPEYQMLPLDDTVEPIQFSMK